jgi:hypothetical protein
MANYMLADADKLDSDLTKVADSIRAKGGTTEPLAFPDGFAAAVNAIVVKTGTEIKRTTGTVRSGNTINCGWKPDLVYLSTGGSDNGYPMTACLAFEASGKDNLNTTTWNSSDDIIDVYATRNATGFNCNLITYDYDNNWAESTYRNSLSYIAVKYTE